MIGAVIMTIVPRLVCNDFIVIYPVKRMRLVIVTDFGILKNWVFDKRFFGHLYSPYFWVVEESNLVVNAHTNMFKTYCLATTVTQPI